MRKKNKKVLRKGLQIISIMIEYSYKLIQGECY